MIITEWKNTIPFAGKVVAYKCLQPTDYYINENNYCLKGNLWGFGMMACEPTKWFSIEEIGGLSWGYNIHKLLKKEAKSIMCALQTEQIKECAGGLIGMRFATKEELKYIGEAIENNEAHFCELFSGDALKILHEQAWLLGDDSN